MNYTNTPATLAAMSGTPGHFLDVSQVANRYRVSTDTIWRWSRNGGFPKGRIVGNPDVVSLNTESFAVADAICDRGTLDDWKANVATYCVGNTVMTTVVSLAFVGPLLEVLGRNGGGLHLRGKSSKGKTTLQQAAASV